MASAAEGDSLGQSRGPKSGRDDDEATGAGAQAAEGSGVAASTAGGDAAAGGQAAVEAEVAALRRQLEEVTAAVPECPICLDVVEYPVELDACHHLFCCNCIYAATPQTPNICPLCRPKIDSAPKPPALPPLQLVDRVKAGRRREEEKAGIGAGTTHTASSSAAAAPTDDDGGASDRRQQDMLVAQQTYQRQMKVVKDKFEAERLQKEWFQRRRSFDQRELWVEGAGFDCVNGLWHQQGISMGAPSYIKPTDQPDIPYLTLCLSKLRSGKPRWFISHVPDENTMGRLEALRPALAPGRAARVLPVGISAF